MKAMIEKRVEILRNEKGIRCGYITKYTEYIGIDKKVTTILFLGIPIYRVVEINGPSANDGK